MKYIIYLLILFFMPLSVLKAQNYIGITPMHKFFQKHADSTYVISYHNPYYIDFDIISKVGDTISAYVYKSNTKLGPQLKEVPKAFRNAFLKNNGNLIYFVPVDINVFFQPKYLNVDSLKQFWAKSSKLNMWSVNDDKIDGDGCDINQKQYAVSDGGEVYLHLITKDNIKELFFYAPEFYEEKCPGRKGRKAMLDFLDLFYMYYNQK